MARPLYSATIFSRTAAIPLGSVRLFMMDDTIPVEARSKIPLSDWNESSSYERNTDLCRQRGSVPHQKIE
jgi:hypothetical protein